MREREEKTEREKHREEGERESMNFKILTNEKKANVNIFKKQFYLFLAVLVLHCCMWAVSCCGKWALGTWVFVVAVHGLSN